MKEYINQQKCRSTVIFLHLPKAAGTTLKDILHRQYKADEVYELDGTQFIQAQENFKQLEKFKKEKIKILMGHMYFGLHEFVNFPATYVTMLRNPLDRVVSYYHFVKKLPSHPDYELIHAKNISLKEYCQMGRENMCNGQTRFLSGTKEFEICDRTTLAVAKQNLQEYFSVVGIQERFDDSLLLFRKKLEWQKMPFYYARNTNRTNSYSQLEIPQDTLIAIKKYNQLDIELYEYANRIFEAEFSKHAQDSRFFKLINQIYGKYFMFARKFFS